MLIIQYFNLEFLVYFILPFFHFYILACTVIDTRLHALTANVLLLLSLLLLLLLLYPFKC